MKIIIPVCVICTFLVCCNTGSLNEQVKSETIACYDRKLSSVKHWERILFRTVADRLKNIEIECLENDGEGNSELRIWTGFSDSQLKGVILKQVNGDWSALFVAPLADPSLSATPFGLHPPHSGWPAFLQRLEELGIYVLPDAVDIGADNSYPDAEAIVIEVKYNGVYRAYMFNGFENIKAPETRKVLDICQTLQSEFDVKLGC